MLAYLILLPSLTGGTVETLSTCLSKAWNLPVARVKGPEPVLSQVVFHSSPLSKNDILHLLGVQQCLLKESDGEIRVVKDPEAKRPKSWYGETWTKVIQAEKQKLSDRRQPDGSDPFRIQTYSWEHISKDDEAPENVKLLKQAFLDLMGLIPVRDVVELPYGQAICFANFNSAVAKQMPAGSERILRHYEDERRKLFPAADNEVSQIGSAMFKVYKATNVVISTLALYRPDGSYMGIVGGPLKFLDEKAKAVLDVSGSKEVDLLLRQIREQDPLDPVGGHDFGHLSTNPKVTKDVLDIVSMPADHEPLSLFARSALSGIAENAGLNLCAIVPDIWERDARVSCNGGKLDLGKFINFISQRGTRVETIGETNYLIPAEIQEVANRRAQRILIQGYATKCIKDGRENFKDYCRLFEKSEDRYISSLLPPIRWCLANSGTAPFAFVEGMSVIVVRLLGSLSDDQMSAAQSKSGLSPSNLSPRQQELLLRWISGPRARLLDQAGPVKDIELDSTYLFRTGVPAQCRLMISTSPQEVLVDAAVDPFDYLQPVYRPVTIPDLVETLVASKQAFDPLAKSLKSKYWIGSRDHIAVRLELPSGIGWVDEADLTVSHPKDPATAVSYGELPERFRTELETQLAKARGG